MSNPYLIALEKVKMHWGTSGQAALAKGILSLYNHNHSYSIGEILAPLDNENTQIVLDMLTAYAWHGETAELRQAGEWCRDNFPRLMELSNAMFDAKVAVRQKWDREQEEENRRLYPDEYK